MKFPSGNFQPKLRWGAREIPGSHKMLFAQRRHGKFPLETAEGMERDKWASAGGQFPAASYPGWDGPLPSLWRRDTRGSTLLNKAQPQGSREVEHPLTPASTWQ